MLTAVHMLLKESTRKILNYVVDGVTVKPPNKLLVVFRSQALQL
jgi:hypothetical protein